MIYDALYRVAGCSGLRGLRVRATNEREAETKVRELETDTITRVLLVPLITIHGMTLT